MKKQTIAVGKAVTLDWLDSKARQGWSYDRGHPREPGYIRSLGYVISSGDDALAISTSIDGNGASMDDLAIPWGCIDRLEVLPGDWARNGPSPEDVEG